MKAILDEFKEQWDGWEISIKLRNEVRLASKIHIKGCEKELKKAKQIGYQTMMAWREAKEESKKAKYRFKSFANRKRYWAKRNMGKVISKLGSSNHNKGSSK